MTRVKPNRENLKTLLPNDAAGFIHRCYQMLRARRTDRAARRVDQSDDEGLAAIGRKLKPNATRIGQYIIAEGAANSLLTLFYRAFWIQALSSQFGRRDCNGQQNHRKPCP